MPLTGERGVGAALPHARLVVIRGAGHYPHAEQPDQFFPAVEDFLTR